MANKTFTLTRRLDGRPPFCRRLHRLTMQMHIVYMSGENMQRDVLTIMTYLLVHFQLLLQPMIIVRDDEQVLDVGIQCHRGIDVMLKRQGAEGAATLATHVKPLSHTERLSILPLSDDRLVAIAFAMIGMSIAPIEHVHGAIDVAIAHTNVCGMASLGAIQRMFYSIGGGLRRDSTRVVDVVVIVGIRTLVG